MVDRLLKGLFLEFNFYLFLMKYKNCNLLNPRSSLTKIFDDQRTGNPELYTFYRLSK